MPIPDLTIINLYLLGLGDNNYFGKYKEGCSHFFRLNKNDDGWDIVPYGSSTWNSLDQQTWNGHDIDEWYGEDSTKTPPEWLPPVPLLEELKKIKSIKWEDNFKTQDSYSTEKMPNLARYFKENNIKEKKLYFALTEDVYESRFGDGIFRYLQKISFSKSDIEDYISNLTPTTENQYGYEGFLKEHIIQFDGNKFTITDFKPLTFEHYEADDLMRVAEELADENAMKLFAPKKDCRFGTPYALTSDGKLYKRVDNPNEKHSYLWEFTDENIQRTDDYFSYSKYEYEKVNWGTKFEKSKIIEQKPFPVSEQMPVLMNQYQPVELEKMLEKYTLQANHWNLFGNSFRYFEKYELAENAYLKAIELDPKNEKPYGNLLSLYILTENYNNYESVYQKGMQNAEPRDFIVLQDGRYQYKKGNYDMAHSAALSVLTAKKMQDEGAWVLGVNALLSMAANETDDNKTFEYYNQAKEMHSRGLFVFPESKELIRLKEKIMDDN